LLLRSCLARNLKHKLSQPDEQTLRKLSKSESETPGKPKTLILCNEEVKKQELSGPMSVSKEVISSILTSPPDGHGILVLQTTQLFRNWHCSAEKRVVAASSQVEAHPFGIADGSDTKSASLGFQSRPTLSQDANLKERKDDPDDSDDEEGHNFPFSTQRASPLSSFSTSSQG